MNSALPLIRLDLDPRNPGEFLACCGLLELADRLWPGGAEGWFDDGQFRLSPVGSAEGSSVFLLLSALIAQLPVAARNESEVGAAPLVAPLGVVLREAPRIVLRLDWWMTIRAERGEPATAGTAWQMWSGQQTPERIWNALRRALSAQLNFLEAQPEATLFTHRVPLPGRFGFDPGAAWNALDVGFSPNEQGMSVATSPAAELLAAVGMQRFAPPTGNDIFSYSTWGVPLSPPAARVAAAGWMSCGASRRFRGRFITRGSYGGLDYSTEVSGDAHE
jgi:CRISPR-associated protein Csx14